MSAPLQVPVEIRLTDCGPHLRRVWRESRTLAPDRVELGRAVPFEPGRPVEVRLRLPRATAPLCLPGVIEPEARFISLERIETASRHRIIEYVKERLSP